MSSTYIIAADASADLDEQLKTSKNIVFIPMQYSLNGQMHTSIGEETAEQMHAFYESQRNGEQTVTSQITPFQYHDFFKQYLKEGQDVLYFSLSSGLSSTYNSSLIAKEEMEQYPGKFYSYDTLAASGGMGVLLSRAIRNRDNGMSIEDNFKDLEETKKKMKHWFLVQNLMYLKAGGRIGAVTAIVGTALGVKPILIIDEQGKLVTISKKRGNISACEDLLKNFIANFDPNGLDPIYIIHADNMQLANTLKEMITPYLNGQEVVIHTLSPIIGAHTGPDMAAICHVGK